MSQHVKEIGALGGLARAANMTDSERSESARAAAIARRDKLKPKRRKEIAAAAAAARWGKK